MIFIRDGIKNTSTENYKNIAFSKRKILYNGRAPKIIMDWTVRFKIRIYVRCKRTVKNRAIYINRIDTVGKGSFNNQLVALAMKFELNYFGKMIIVLSYSFFTINMGSK